MSDSRWVDIEDDADAAADATATVAAARLIAERRVEETIRFKGVVDAE